MTPDDQPEPARSLRTRSFVLVSVLAVAVVVLSGVALSLGHDGKEPRRPTGSTYASLRFEAPPTARGRTFEDNSRVARAESARTMKLAPVPVGARRLAGEPATWPKTGSLSAGATTPGLERVSWYRVAMGGDQARRFILGHTPRGMARDGDVGRRIGNVLYTDYYPRKPRNQTSYAGPDMLVQWHSVGGITLIRVEVYILVLPVREQDTFVTGAVSGVDLYLQRITGQRRPRSLPPVQLVAPADNAVIRRLTTAFNRLRPNPDPLPMHSCPMMAEQTERVVFHQPGRTVVAEVVQGCEYFVRVTVDRQEREGTLDPGRYADLLAAIARSR